MNSDHMKLHTLKAGYLLLMSAGLGLLAILNLFSGAWLSALMTAACVIALLLFAVLMPLRGRRPGGAARILLALPLTGVAGLIGAASGDLAMVWSLIFCGLAVYLLRFRHACRVIPAYGLVWVFVVLLSQPSLAALPMLFVFSACAALALGYAWVNGINLKNLSAVANTDPVTMVYNQYQFTLDLQREMTRAERLMDELHLVGLRPPQLWQDLGAEEFERRLNDLASLLRSCLKKTDTCYRLNSDDFVLLTPHSNDEATAEFMDKIAQVLQDSTYEELTALNVSCIRHEPGDEVDTMVQKVGESLNAVA